MEKIYMKLLLENWRKYLNEDSECRTVIAYHGSPQEFDKFAQDKMPSYFITSRDDVRKFTPVTYIYEVELTLCGEGVRYPQKPSEGDKYVWDHGHSQFQDEKPLVYKMFNAKDIKIIPQEDPSRPGKMVSAIEEETEFDWY